MESQHRLGLLLKMVNNIYAREFNNKISEIDLTVAQCDILGFLHENEHREINPIDIEKKLNLKRPTITGLLKRLEEKGFIKFEVSSKDNRYKQVILTQKAHKHHQEVMTHLKKMEEKLYQNISEEEKVELARMLNIMLNNMSV